MRTGKMLLLLDLPQVSLLPPHPDLAGPSSLEQPGDAPRTNVNLTCFFSVVPALMPSTTGKHPGRAEGTPGPERRGCVHGYAEGPSFNQYLHRLGHVHELSLHYVVWIIRTSSSRSCVSWHLAQCLAHGVCQKKGH